MTLKPGFAAALAAIAALVAPGAGADEDRLFATLMAQYVIYDDARPFENDLGVQLGMGFPVLGDFALELNYLIRSAGLQGGGAVDTVDQDGYGLDVLWFFDRNGALDGYLLLGVGRHSDEYGPEGDDSYTSRAVGIGVMDAITDNLTFRAELRALRGGDINGSTDVALGVGVAYLFGEPAKVMAPVRKTRDSDGDGVNDRRDRCPDTPPGASVQADGCPAATGR